MSSSSTRFVYMVCQSGAEGVLKKEIARVWPTMRLAFSRPGFVTFKLPPDFSLPDDFDLKSVFARLYGFSMGKVTGTNGNEMAAEFWKLLGERSDSHLHVFQRDAAVPGDFDFEPGVTPLADSVGETLLQSCPWQTKPRLNGATRPNQTIVDCVMVEPNEWWAGYHVATSVPSRWPGGVIVPEIPEHLISRAYLKMCEALDWSRLPIEPGDRVCEFGAAPGGSCQALVDRGARVWGVDPADIDAELLENPNFVHIRKRAADVPRRDLQGIKWLMSDLNVAPNFTLDAVEALVTHRSSQIRGMLLTLKLANWDLADEIPQYIARIRSWGYEYVRARQLAFNRQEICVAAMKSRSMRRPSLDRTRTSKPVPKTTSEIPENASPSGGIEDAEYFGDDVG